jgi:hypothetical protein
MIVLRMVVGIRIFSRPSGSAVTQISRKTNRETAILQEAMSLILERSSSEMHLGQVPAETQLLLAPTSSSAVQQEGRPLVLPVVEVKRLQLNSKLAFLRLSIGS